MFIEEKMKIKATADDNKTSSPPLTKPPTIGIKDPVAYFKILKDKPLYCIFTIPWAVKTIVNTSVIIPNDHFTKDNSVLCNEFSLIVLEKLPIITKTIETFKMGRKVFLVILVTKKELIAVIGLNITLPNPPENSDKVINVGKQISTDFDILLIRLFASKKTCDINLEIKVTTKK